MHEGLKRMDSWRESRFHPSIYSPLSNPYFTLNSFLAEKITKRKIEKLLKQLIEVHYKCLALYWTLLDVAGSGIQFHTLTWPVPSPVKNMLPGPVWIARTSCLLNILPLSANLNNKWAKKLRMSSRQLGTIDIKDRVITKIELIK